MPNYIEHIKHINEFANLYRHTTTGIAFVADGSTGTQYSCHANIASGGSVRGMKKLGYWDKKARTVRCNGAIYNIDTYIVNDSPYSKIAGDYCMCEACKERRASEQTKKGLPSYKLSELYPKGISQKQAEQLHSYLFKVFGSPYNSKWPNEAHMVDSELSLVSMLDSHYAYGDVRTVKRVFKEPRPTNIMNPRGESYYDSYLRDYQRYGGTKEEFDKYIDIQISHYKHCDVLKGVGSDDEGNIYNSIKDVDEPCNIKI